MSATTEQLMDAAEKALGEFLNAYDKEDANEDECRVLLDKFFELIEIFGTDSEEYIRLNEERRALFGDGDDHSRACFSKDNKKVKKAVFWLEAFKYFKLGCVYETCGDDDDNEVDKEKKEVAENGTKATSEDAKVEENSTQKNEVNNDKNENKTEL